VWIWKEAEKSWHSVPVQRKVKTVGVRGSQELRTRGVLQVDLLVTDGHEGLLAGVADLFPTTLRHRCLVHKQRNVMSAIPKREQQEVLTELKGIWQQEKKEDALLNLAAFKAKYQKRYPEAVRSLCEDEEHLLTFYTFPPVMHRYIRSTNAIESLFSNVRQRTDQIDAFTTETSCLTIVWAVDAGYSLAQDSRRLSAEARWTWANTKQRKGCFRRRCFLLHSLRLVSGRKLSVLNDDAVLCSIVDIVGKLVHARNGEQVWPSHTPEHLPQRGSTEAPCVGKPLHLWYTFLRVVN
jgi:hypothetical protein